MFPKKSINILILGIGDNANTVLIKSLKNKFNIKNIYFFLTDTEGRGEIKLYIDEKKERSNIIFKELPKDYGYNQFCHIDKKLQDFINKEVDLAIISGHRGLLYSRHLTCKKAFIPVGYEIYLQANFFNNFKSSYSELTKNKEYKNLNFSKKKFNNFYYGILNKIKLVNLTKQSIKNLDFINETFEPNIRVLKKLKLKNKLHSKRFPIIKNNYKYNSELLKKLEERFCKSKLNVLWFSRIIYKDKKIQDYKGVEIFMKALLKLNNLINSGQISIIMTNHGRDWRFFESEYRQLPFFDKINFVNHLSKKDLYSYLSLSKSILVDEIVQNNMLYGLARDALTCNLPIISNYNNILNIDKKKIKVLYSKNSEQITKNILKAYKNPEIIDKINKFNNDLIKREINEEKFIRYLILNSLGNNNDNL